MQHTQGQNTAAGFTLIELLIVLAILGILTVIAVPAYQNHVIQSRRAEAQTVMLQIQLLQEKWRANNATYGTIADIGAPASNDYYNFSITGNNATNYTINAVVKSGTAQADDTDCTTLTINQSGAKTPSDCWKS